MMMVNVTACRERGGSMSESSRSHERRNRLVHVQRHRLMGQGRVALRNRPAQHLVQHLYAIKLIGLAPLETAQGRLAVAFNRVRDHRVAAGLPNQNVQLHVQSAVRLRVAKAVAHRVDALVHLEQLRIGVPRRGQSRRFALNAAPHLDQFQNGGVVDLHHPQEIRQQHRVGQVTHAMPRALMTSTRP